MIRVPVVIVGGGPSGLMVSHLLARTGIDSVVVERRARAEIYATGRAGILEAGSVRLLVDSGVSDRVLREGDRHEGIELRFGGRSHRIDFADLVGQSVWLYPQTEVFEDLANRRAADGGAVYYGASDVEVTPGDDGARVRFLDADGVEQLVHADFVVGADGSRSESRRLVPESDRDWRRHEYPFAWFGVLTQAPRSADELIYADSDHGFALISQRSETVQRMYFQCDPSERPEDWDDDRIWATLRERVKGNGFELREGPIIEKTVLPFRSAVHAPMRYGRLLLAGDSAHTVPPTGAKGLNLALHDAELLAEALAAQLAGDDRALDAYPERALERVWKAQHFSYWMTTMLHRAPGASPFENARRRGELEAVVSSRHGRAFLAEAYTGWA
ncbi:4-hydroxybenzoate 3-monooxygenase [Tsukamurella spumae]